MYGKTCFRDSISELDSLFVWALFVKTNDLVEPSSYCDIDKVTITMSSSKNTIQAQKYNVFFGVTIVCPDFLGLSLLYL